MKSHASTFCPFLILAALLIPSASAQVDPNIEQGLKLYGSYNGGNLDLVNLNNGHLTFRAPFYSLPQRGGKLTLSFSILYDNLIGAFVQATCQPPPHQATCSYAVLYYGSSAQIINDQGYAMIKNLVNSGQVDSSGNPVMLPVFYILGQDGAQHQLVYTTDGHYQTIDGSNIRVDQTNGNFANPAGTLTDSNGVRQPIASAFQPSPPIPNASAGFSSLEDPNGNEITYSSSTKTYTDTLGRNLNLTPATGSVSTCPQLNFPYQSVVSASILNFLAPNGGTMPVTLCSANVYIRSNACTTLNLPRCTDYSGYVSMLQSIILPNGTYWAFQYSAANPNDPNTSAYGNLLEVAFPTGGSITYTYGATYGCPLSPPSQATIGTPQVLTRTVNANDGTGPHTWTYNWTSQPNSTVTDPLGQKVVHTFTGFEGCSYYETQTQTYDASNNLLKTTKIDYTYLENAVSNLENTDLAAGVVPIRTTTTWPNGQVTKNETDYDAGFSYRDPTYYWVLTNSTNACQGGCVVDYSTYAAIFGKPVASRGYDYGTNGPGALLRQIKTAYEWQSNSNYLTTNLLNLPSSVITYDGSGNRVAETDSTYDNPSYLQSSGITTQHTSAPGPVRGNLSTVQRWLNTTNSFITSTTTMFDTGTVPNDTDPLSHPVNRAYSTSFAGAYVTTVTNALKQSANHNYDFNTGLLTSTTDPNNLTTSFSYDNMWRLASVTAPDGAVSTITHQETTFPFSTTLNKPINPSQTETTTNVFDGLGRLTQSQLTSDPQGTVYTDTTYDALGQVATVSNPYRQGNDPTTTTGTTTYGYDALGRKTSETYPDGSILTTAYCGPSTLVTDPTGKWRRSRVDGLGRLVEVDEPNAPGATVNSNGCPGTGEPIWVTTYGYDPLGNLTSVVQNGSHQRTFVYDSLSQLLTSTNPEVGTINYSYNNDGVLISKTDARGITTNYSPPDSPIDSLHRVTKISYSNGDPSLTFAYDQANCLGLSSCQNIGHRTSMTDAAGSESWAFQVDPTNHRNVHVEQRTTNSIMKTSTYYLDQAGNVYQIQYPTSSTGRVVNYTFDNADRPSTAIDGSSGITYATDFQTAPTGCLSGKVCYTPQGTFYALSIGQSSGFTGLNLTHIYNSRLQPNEFKASSSGGDAIDISYNFVDPSTTKNAGIVYGITNNLDTTRSQTFTYDQLNRITSALTTSTYSTSPSHCWGETYTLDAWANLNTIAATTNSNYTGCSGESGFSSSADGNNHLPSWAYDASGNATSDSFITNYQWNGESQLKSGAGVGYLYDGDGRRVSKVGSKLYWYGSGDDILAETDASGNTTAEYIFFGGKRIAMIPWTGTPPVAGNPTYYVEDMLGTSRVITTNAGVVCYDADFYPYGGERSYTNTCPQNYKFEGKERDTETGNDDFGARYYSNRFGRWLSADWSAVPAPVPYANLANPQTLNLYSMVADDPESFADLDGHTQTQIYQLANSAASSAWDPFGAESMSDMSGMTLEEFTSLQAVAASSQTTVNVNVNVIWDTGSNGSTPVGDADKKKFEGMRKETEGLYSKVNITFKFKYTEGWIQWGANGFPVNEGVIGAEKGSINVFVMHRRLPVGLAGANEGGEASTIQGGKAFTFIGLAEADHYYLSHSFAHHFLGHTQPGNGGWNRIRDLYINQWVLPHIGRFGDRFKSNIPNVLNPPPPKE